MTSSIIKTEITNSIQDHLTGQGRIEQENFASIVCLDVVLLVIGIDKITNLLKTRSNEQNIQDGL